MLCNVKLLIDKYVDHLSLCVRFFGRWRNDGVRL